MPKNVELTWVGGKCLAFDTSQYPGKRLNMRTMPLTWFCKTSRLKTLVIHLSESSKGYIRRPYEPESIKLFMKGKTAGQPNTRLTRALRCCQGMDYIYQLRGLHWLHVYDLKKTVEMVQRHPVRDSSFVIDLQRVVTQEKVPSQAAKASLRQLKRLFPTGSWKPSQSDFRSMRQVFDEETGYDTRENDLDHDATSSRGTLSPEGSDYEGPDDGSTDDEGLDDEGSFQEVVDNEGPEDESLEDEGTDKEEDPRTGLPTPPASNRRDPTPAPIPVEISDSDEDEESEHDGSETDEVDDDDAMSINTDIVRHRPPHQDVRRNHAPSPAHYDSD